MGKIWVLAMTVAILASCTKVDNRNITITFFRDGEKNSVNLKPDDQLIEKSTLNGEITYKDKFDRWQHVKPDKIILEEDDGSMLVQDGSTGEYVWKTINSSGEQNLYQMQNNVENCEEIASNKIPIQYQDFGEFKSDDTPKPEYNHPENLKIKITNQKFPAIPQRIRDQYKVNDPFFLTFNTLEQGWLEYQKITQNRVLTYGREVEKTFFSNKYKTDFAFLKHDAKQEMLYRYDKYEVEPNSYWVDRKVGTFKPFKYEARPCKEVPVLRSNHFKEDVKTYVEKTLKPVWYWSNGEEQRMTPRTVVESARITMVPMSQKVWIIFVGSQSGKEDPDLEGIWTFSVVQFDSPKPILRSWGQKTFGYTGTEGYQGYEKTYYDWADPEKNMELYGIGDVNYDGFKDFIFRYNGWGCATQDSHSIFIISLTDRGFVELAPADWSFYDFFGFDGKTPLFQYEHYGTGQLYQSYRNESLASTRWNRHILKVVQPKSDGNLYMVSYKYNKDIEDKIRDINNKDIHYLSLGEYEIIGKTRAAQQAFLESVNIYDDEQSLIVNILLKKNHTMYVDSHEDLLPELKKFEPYP